MRSLLPLLLSLAFLFSPSMGRATVLDRVVAVISAGSARTLITWTDLELEARVALIGRGGIGAADGKLAADTLAATLEWLVAEHLLLAEAEQLAVVRVDASDLEGQLAAFRARFRDPAAYEAFLTKGEISEADLLRILRRRAIVDGYLASRLRLGVSISESEVRRAWQARKAELGDFETVRPLLRAQLEKTQREELVKALVADLRSRAEVRVLHDLGVRRDEKPAARPWILPGDGERGE